MYYSSMQYTQNSSATRKIYTKYNDNNFPLQVTCLVAQTHINELSKQWHINVQQSHV